MKNVALILLMTLCFVSCDRKDSYTVWVKNSTGEDLTIAYKSTNDLRGVVEETITLKDGAAETIIRTGNFEVAQGNVGDAPKACEFVAEYFNVSIRGNIQSKVKWCDPSIKMETVDIGEVEFMMEYKLSDFPLGE